MPQTKRYPNPYHKDDPVRFSTVLRQWILDFPWDRVSKADRSLLEKGRLMMKCEYCGTESIAGCWCWKCGRMAQPESWFEAKNVSPEGKRRRGRPSKAEMAEVIKYCEDCTYAYA